MNFSSGSFTSIAVNNAQTVVSDTTGSKLLVFSGDSDSITVLSPTAAVPPVDHQLLQHSGERGLHGGSRIRSSGVRGHRWKHGVRFELRSSVRRDAGKYRCV